MSDDNLGGLGTPNCPRDLVPMELDGEGDAVRWRCPECGLVILVRDEGAQPTKPDDGGYAEWSANEDEFYRHVGRIVVLGAELEAEATQVLSYLANRQAPNLAKLLIQGARMDELIGALGRLLPGYADKKLFLDALRRANEYRDHLAHSTRVIFDLDAFKDSSRRDVRWIERQRRNALHRMRLRVADFHSVEQQHMRLLSGLGGILLAYSEGAGEPPETPTIEWAHIPNYSPPADAPSCWANREALSAADRIIGG